LEFLVLDYYIGSSSTILLHYKAVPGIYAKEKQRNFFIFELWLTNATLSDFVNLVSQRNNDYCLAGFQELMITLTSSVTLVIQNPSYLYSRNLFLVCQSIPKKGYIQSIMNHTLYLFNTCIKWKHIYSLIFYFWSYQDSKWIFLF
jgi:hypothetical protein